MRGLCSFVPAPVRLFEVTEDQLTLEQGAHLVEALTSCASVILHGARQSELIARIGHHWPDFAEYGGHCSIVHNVDFDSKHHMASATVFLLVPEYGERYRSDRPLVWPLGDENVKQAEILGSAKNFHIEPLGMKRRATTIKLTMRELYLLHERDPLGTPPPRSLNKILSSADQLTWAELRELLQEDRDQEFMDEQRQSGRLTDEKYNYALAGLHLIEEQHKAARHVYPDIYSAVWSLERVVQPGMIFRGQAHAEWGLQPTLLRPRGGGLDIAELQNRIALTEDFLTELRTRQSELFGGPLGEDELLAVAQHFGFPTPLLDYTRSLKIAAFFATSSQSVTGAGPSIGVIYYHFSGPEDTFRPQRPAGLLPSLTALAGVRVGALSVIAPDIPQEDDRIRRQQGVFVGGYRPHDLQSITIDRIYFRQMPEMAFEDPREGITGAALLPDKTPLSALAALVKNRRRQAEGQTFMMGKTLLNDMSIIGTADSRLYWHLRFGQEFLERLSENVSKTFPSGSKVDDLSTIIMRYFTLARIAVDVGTIPDSELVGQAILPLPNAVSALETWAALPNNAIWKIVGKYAPPYAPVRFGTAARPNDWSSIAYQALSCAVFLTGWEHLRTANGTSAHSLIQTAELWLLSENGPA